MRQEPRMPLGQLSSIRKVDCTSRNATGPSPKTCPSRTFASGSPLFSMKATSSCMPTNIRNWFSSWDRRKSLGLSVQNTELRECRHLSCHLGLRPPGPFENCGHNNYVNPEGVSSVGRLVKVPDMLMAEATIQFRLAGLSSL